MATAQPKRGLHIALWIVQVLLVFMFGMSGAMKSFVSIDQLAQRMIWPGALPEALVRFIGFAELAGAVGLLLPSLTRIQPKLTPLAAAGLTVVMILAVLFHLSRGEFNALPITLSLGALSAFVAWGRFKAAPIAPRS